MWESPLEGVGAALARGQVLAEGEVCAKEMTLRKQSTVYSGPSILY